MRGSLDQLPNLPEFLDGLEAFRDETELRNQWRRIGAHMRQGRFQALGVTWLDHPGPPYWHLDPGSPIALNCRIDTRRNGEI